MRGKFIFLLYLIYGLFLLGLASLNGSIIALAFPLVLYLGVGFLYSPEKLKLSGLHSISADRIFEGAPVVVNLSVINESNETEEILVEDVVSPGLELTDGESQALSVLPPGGKIDLEYTLRGQRGVYGFNSFRAGSGDTFNLFRKQVQVLDPANQASPQLLIQPNVIKLHQITIRPPQTRGFAGPIPARQGGAGVNFFGVREYQAGDPLRWINWKVTTRHPEEGWFTNVFEQERIADVGIILDARQKNNVQTSDGYLFEYSVRAAASLADVFLDEGNRVGLLIYGAGRDSVFPGYGKVQRERILQVLARTRTGHNYALETLNLLPIRAFPARSQIILISPLSQDDAPVLVRLRAHGYELIVLSPDPVDSEVKARAKDRKPVLRAAYARRIAGVERALMFRSLRRAGIRVVDWQVDRPLDQVLQESLSRQRIVRRRLELAL